jgi:hypothetical protein
MKIDTQQLGYLCSMPIFCKTEKIVNAVYVSYLKF